MNTKKFINFRYIFYPFLIFLFGIYMARGLYAGVVENLVITLILLISLGSILIYKKKYKILAILFACFFLGNGFYFLGEHRYKVKDYLGVVSVVGRVSDRFEEGEHSYTIVLDDVSIAGENAKNIELYISKDSNARDLEVGDILAFESEVEVMPLFSLSSLNSSIARQDIGYSASVKQSELIITKGYKKFDEGMFLLTATRDNAVLCFFNSLFTISNNTEDLQKQLLEALQNKRNFYIVCDYTINSNYHMPKEEQDFINNLLRRLNGQFKFKRFEILGGDGIIICGER